MCLVYQKVKLTIFILMNHLFFSDDKSVESPQKADHLLTRYHFWHLLKWYALMLDILLAGDFVFSQLISIFFSYGVGGKWLQAYSKTCLVEPLQCKITRMKIVFYSMEEIYFEATRIPKSFVVDSSIYIAMIWNMCRSPV